MGTSIKKNFFYSSFLTAANYIFPLLTFPYVTRVLGATNFGICDFVDSIINYFILFSNMGIGIVGIREIAVAKYDRGRLSGAFSELVSIIGIFTVLSVIVLIISTLYIPRLMEYKEMMFLGAFKILFNFLLIEWFYKGLENFKFITIRTLAVKCVYVVAVFIFVRQSDDYPAYYLLTILMIGVNAIVNSVYARRHVSYKLVLPSKGLLAALFIYGCYSILTSFYTTFNVTYLGFATDTTQVGYYSTASKLFTIFIALFTAFTGVMLPRMSSLVEEDKLDEFKSLYLKSIDLLCATTVPVVFFSIAMSESIIYLIAGNGYGGAIVPMRIVMPLLFVIGYEQILVIQALMPLKKDKTVLRNSFFGALAGILGNILLVADMGAVGSSIVWVSCEILILVLSQIAVHRALGISFPLKTIARYTALYAPLLLLYYIPGNGSIKAFLIGTCISFGYYIIIQLSVLKNSFISSYILNRLSKYGK